MIADTEGLTVGNPTTSTNPATYTGRGGGVLRKWRRGEKGKVWFETKHFPPLPEPCLLESFTMVSHEIAGRCTRCKTELDWLHL